MGEKVFGKRIWGSTHKTSLFLFLSSNFISRTIKGLTFSHISFQVLIKKEDQKLQKNFVANQTGNVWIAFDSK